MTSIKQRRAEFADKIIKAASLVEQGEHRFSCNAVLEAFGRIKGGGFSNEAWRYKGAYARMVSPRPERNVLIWDFEGTGAKIRKGAKEHRVTAMCLVAARVLDGDLDDLLPK